MTTSHTSGAADRCQACADRNDGFYGSYAPKCPAHNDDGTPRDTALAKAQQPALTAQAISAPTDHSGDVNKMVAPDHIAESGNMVAQAISAVTAVDGALEVADAMADSQYLAGVSAGWNAANADDPNAALQKLHESRAGYLKPLRAARALAASHGQAPAPQTYAEALQVFESPRAKTLMRAWEEGWAACRDAEFVGEEAQNDAFNLSTTVNQCIVEDMLHSDRPAPPAMDGGEDAEQERPVQRMEGWTDTRYIAELENVARLLRRDREKLHRVRDALSEKGGR